VGVVVVSFSLLLYTAPTSSQPSDHDYRQDDNLQGMQTVMNNHLIAASSLLAEIQTKLDIAIGIGSFLILALASLLSPKVRKKIGMGLFLLIALNLTGCMPVIPDTSNKIIEVCQYGYCRSYCFTNAECHPTCYCARDGLCRNR